MYIFLIRLLLSSNETNKMDMDFLKNWKQWVELIFPLLIFVGIYLFRQLRHLTKGKRLKEIAPLLNGKVVIRPFTKPRIEGNFMGLPYKMTFSSAGRGSPGKMKIQIESPGFFRLTLVPKARSTGLEEIFSRGKILSTGEDSFNSLVVARTEKEREKAMLYLDNQVNRGMILNLFEAGRGHSRVDVVRMTAG